MSRFVKSSNLRTCHRATCWMLVVAAALTPARGLVGSVARADESSVASTADLSATIDRRISARWSAEGLRPAPPADDAEFVRRLYLDLTGRIPTRAEQQAFRYDRDSQQLAADRQATQRRNLIEKLMASDEYTLHFANQLNAYLMGRTEFPAHAEWFGWLRASLSANKGWNQMVRELLVARSTDSEHAGASEFLVRRLPDGSRLDEVTRDVTRLFFGVDMQCARCHSHPEIPEWEPESYWGMAAFFNRSYLVEIDGRKHVAERARGEVSYTSTETKESNSVGPRFMTGATPPPQDKPPHESPERLVQRKAEHPKAKLDDPLLDNPDEYLVVPSANPAEPSQPRYSRRSALVALGIDQQNPYFARAFVNRVWAWLMGRGLVEPLDQLHTANVASHPELLNALATDFVAHDYDIRRLIYGIVGSQAYQLSSVRLSQPDEFPDPAEYVQARVRPLTAHQQATAVLCAVGFLEADGSRAEFETRQAERFAALVKRFDTGSDQFQPSLPLALYLANNKEFEELINEGGLARRLAETSDDEQLVRMAFEAVLCRPPDADELAAVRSFLASRRDHRDLAIRQFLWSLLTSSEFRFNH